MVNIAICDDDLVFATKIESILFNISKNQMIDMSVEVYSDGIELWEDIKNGHNFEILYLDIEMVKLNGIDVAKRIRQTDSEVIIIYSNFPHRLVC